MERLSKWQQQREGRPMGPNVYPDPSCEGAARAPRSGAKEEMQLCYDGCYGPRGWGHVSQTEDEEGGQVQGSHKLGPVIGGS